MKKLIPATVLTSLLTLIVLATLALQHGSGAAQGPLEVSVDADPEGNTADSLGSQEGCVSVSSGDTFDVDITISNVDDLVAWELYLKFEPSIVQVVDADIGMFLASNPGSSLIRKSDAYIGRQFLGAADQRLLGASGSGVLARVTLQAIGPGVSDARILYLDFNHDGRDDFGPRLTDREGSPIGDVTGDGVFDGPTNHAIIAVDESCDAATPTPTLPPTPTPQPGEGNPDTSPPGDDGSGPLPVPGDPEFEPVSATSSPDEQTGSSEASEEGEGSAANGTDERDGSAAAAAIGANTPTSGSSNDSIQPQGGGSSSSSSGEALPLWAVGAIAATVLVVGAGTSVYLAARIGGPRGR
jgi:hypothetical protein